MWKISAQLAIIATAFTAIETLSSELQPFHVSQFDDGMTVNLSIMSVAASPARGYDFDVTIGLIGFDTHGAVIYNDDNLHAARVDCSGRGKVLVGGATYVPRLEVNGDDWKEDLLKALCTSPIS